MDATLRNRLVWFAEGESALMRALMDASLDLDAPSRLSGWRRRHVVAHLIGNADALGNLVHWARTGEPRAMYASPGARQEQIMKDAEKEDVWLISACRDAIHRLSEAVYTLRGPQWDALVRTAQGREVRAAEIPWLRTRESFIHSFDLNVGFALEKLHRPLVDALLDDAVANFNRRREPPAVLLIPSDRERTWSIADDDADRYRVEGTAAQILSWLIGRPPMRLEARNGYPVNAPPLPTWL
ncbi:maleylpyruvate isomerase family mycothiol-dependent enzyme [Streptomyces sp. NPDC096311]|uniref:maleylpyruvate isomerase family mycothiol-dependent enzyme n=1 Tax=Streptomyces sp. NPDC096311 TaxID=3366083 RepID=UPI0037F22E95